VPRKKREEIEGPISEEQEIGIMLYIAFFKIKSGFSIYATSSEYRIGVVASLLLLALNSPPEKKLGLQGARRLLAQINATVKDREDHRVAGDEKYMKAAWRTGHCVAHLCAALALWQAWHGRPKYRLFELLDQSTSTPPSRAIFDPGSLETLPNFLAAPMHFALLVKRIFRAPAEVAWHRAAYLFWMLQKLSARPLISPCRRWVSARV
jgi:hypothetical protein